ncbi:MAG: DUF177 domain-containing protein [Deltaproteobacteria bacterium]|nr:DUF177 domain-containing protein [Deltaproteobacteria bacterium]
MKSTAQNSAPRSLSSGMLTVETGQLERQSEFAWLLPVSWLQNILNQCEYDVTGISGECRALFSNASGTLHLTGTIRFSVETECATCLSKLKLDLCAHIDTFMQPADTADNSQDELTPEDLDIEYYTGTTLELEGLVSDSILLELPMIPRCDGTCRKIDGLVTAAELEQKEQTVDPRLKALADIKLSKES